MVEHSVSAVCVALLLALSLATCVKGQQADCQATTYFVEDLGPLPGMLDGLGSNSSSWVSVCMDSGLVDLESCLFPPVGTELLINCQNDTSELYTTFVDLLNYTNANDFGNAVSQLLTIIVNQGVLSLDDAAEVQDWLIPLITNAFGADYDTRSAGACGVNALGLNLPVEVVGTDINSCCKSHDKCYNDCGGFDQCNGGFGVCLTDACAAIPHLTKPVFTGDIIGYLSDLLEYKINRATIAACNTFAALAFSAVSSDQGLFVYCNANDGPGNSPTQCCPA